MTPLSRRDFLTAGAAAGAGLVIGFYLPRNGASPKNGFAPNAYLRIASDEKITVVVARSEMGQGVWTALPMILAEELEADWKKIAVEQAGASMLYGDQSTGGSASVRTTWDPMRKAGAQAREMLITAAALEWGVPRATCKPESGYIVHASSNRRTKPPPWPCQPIRHSSRRKITKLSASVWLASTPPIKLSENPVTESISAFPI
jgi:isoquinoline 1-oxidoreductase beta subunit